MPNLRSHLHDLANEFAAGVLLAIRSASIEDLLGETGRERRSAPRAAGRASTPAKTRGGRLARRSPEDVAKVLAAVVSALKATKGKGLRSEQIQAALKLDKRELPRVIAMGLAKKAIKKKGQKRSTTYFAA
jgi:hypothetical protein